MSFAKFLIEEGQVARKLFGVYRRSSNALEKKKLSRDISTNFIGRAYVESVYIIPKYLRLTDTNYKIIHDMKLSTIQSNELLTKVERLTSNQKRFEEEFVSFNTVMEEIMKLSEEQLERVENVVLPEMENKMSATEFDEIGNDAKYDTESNHYVLSKAPQLFSGNEYFIELNEKPQPSKNEIKRQEFEKAEQTKIAQLETEVMKLSRDLQKSYSNLEYDIASKSVELGLPVTSGDDKEALLKIKDRLQSQRK